ncbi:hypothetical protein DENSPDRAFT_854845 [Dentipellis sp. KUC8613]|nr:hypothetical protein DENSPDRAFT_854845 [Dentipellis sp. KUC8613]
MMKRKQPLDAVTEDGDDERTTRSSKSARLRDDVPALEDGADTDTQRSSSPSRSPPAEDVLIDRLPYHSAHDIRRIRVFLDMSNNGRNLFSILRVPLDVNWPSDDNDKMISLRRQDDPRDLVFWIIGYVKGWWFTEKDKTPADRMSVSIAPASPEALLSARSVLDRFAGYAGDYDNDNNSLRIARWQSTRKRGGGGSEVKPFTRVYDAMSAFRSKDLMKMMDTKLLDIDDTVLVEATVTRYKREDVWHASFELQSVAVLRQNPSAGQEPVTVDNGFDESI